MGIMASSEAVTVVLDFNDPTQGTTERTNKRGDTIDTFDIRSYGFDDTAANRTALTNRILEEVKADFHFDIGQVTGNSAMNGKRLDINFVIGDAGVAPSNGDSEYYVVQIGTGDGAFGVAVDSSIRRADGSAGYYQGDSSVGPPTTPGGDLVVFNHGDAVPNGAIVSSVYASNLVIQLYSTDRGDIERVTNLFSGTISHEVGHALSLKHLDFSKAHTKVNGKGSIMATGLPRFEWRYDRHFTLAGTDEDGDATNPIDQLQTALGVTNITQVPEPSSLLCLFAGLGIFTLYRKR